MTALSAARERPPWLVSIRRSRQDDPVGAGLLVTARHILTCAHVVRSGTALGLPEEPVFVQFQFAPAHEPLAARVVPGGWHPAAGADTGDVAVLELDSPPPPGTAPAPLRSTEPGTWDHRFRAYGYPREHPRQGVPVRGEIIGHAGSEWLQVEASPHSGWALEQGFSGSPVWDMNSQGVVGMLVARDPVTKVDRRTAYAIRVETLVRYWPGLAPHVRDATTEEVRDRLESLLWIPLAADGELPRVDQVDPHDIGVSRSKYSDHPHGSPYVPRSPQDGQLDAALADSRFVVLAGRSKAGKSRTLYEALRRGMPGARLIVPRPDGPGLRALDDLSRLALPTGQDPVVLWLDDLHRYLQPGGLDLQILDRLARRRPAVTIAATIPAKQRAALGGMDNDVGRIARTVLGKARTIELPPQLGPQDAAVARGLYPAEDFAARGIGELMVAAPSLEQRFDDAAESCPAGWALVKAATDWHRMGVTGPVPEEALRELFSSYTAVFCPQADSDEAAYLAAVAWARQPVAGEIALLYRARGPDGRTAYTATPYMAECLDNRAADPSAAVPAFAWEFLAGRQPAAELLPIAYTALVREETGIAERMLRQITDTATDPDSAAWASLMLGEIRVYSGDFAEAVALLERAADSAAESVVPLAQIELAGVLTLTGERARALRLLETAAGSRDPQISQMAQVGLAGVLVRQGESERAEELLESILAAGDSEVAPLAQTQLVRMLTDTGPAGVRSGSKPGGERAKPAGSAVAARAGTAQPSEQPWILSRAVGNSLAGQITALARANLGGLLVNQGKLDRAEALLRSVADSGQVHAMPMAQTCLGELLILRERYDEAREMLQTALRSGHPLIAPAAQVMLGMALLAQDDAEQGVPLLRQVALSRHPDQAPRAAYVLARWYAADQDDDTSSQWLGRAIASGHPDWAGAARVELAVLLSDDEAGLAQTEELLREVAGSGHPEQAPRAADLLGDLLVRADRREEAEEAYRTAIDSGHGEWPLVARIDLAMLLSDDEAGLEQAEELLREVAGSGHPEQAPRAADLLGDLLVRADRREEAEEAYRTAIDSGHGQWPLVARIDLAMLLSEHEDFASAEALLREVAGSPNATAAAWGRTMLGVVLIHDGRRAAGMAQLRAAADCDVLPAAQMARFQLAKRLVEDGDEDGAAELLHSIVAGAPGDLTAAARAHLCVLLLHRGDTEAAEELLLGVERSGDPEAITVAYLGTGEYLLDVGELQAAGELLRAALDLDDPQLTPRAAALLGVVRRSANDLEEARRLLSDALAADDPTVEPLARRYLGSTLFRLGLRAEAEHVLEPLARSQDTEHRPQALLLLGQVLAADGRPDAAYTWFEQAIECGDPDTEAAARYDYAELLMSAGRQEHAREVFAPQVAGEEQAELPLPDRVRALPPAPRAVDGQSRRGSAHPLPAAVLALLGDVADAEGDAQEARYWYALAGRAAGEPSTG